MVSVDLQHQGMAKQFDFVIGASATILEGSAADSRPQLLDEQSHQYYRLVGDSRAHRLLVASGSALYSVPYVEQRDYQWTDWKWKPYTFEDSKP